MHRSVIVGLVAVAICLATAGVTGPALAVAPPDATADGHADRTTAESIPLVSPEPDTGPSASRPAPAAVRTGTDDGDESHDRALQDGSSQQFDSTTFDITVYENGTATWTFRYERILGTQSEEDEFLAFAEEFESDETDLYNRFTDQARALTETGSEHTDREMAATNFERSARIDHRPNAMGVVEMTFTWEGFAAVDEDGTLTVGDVFEGGLYIGSDQTLTVRAGDDLAFSSVLPEGEHSGNALEGTDSVTWTGEHEFLDGRPRLVLAPPEVVDEERSDDGGETGPDSGDDGGIVPDAIGLSTATTVVAGLALLAVALGAAGWYRFGGTRPEALFDSDADASLEATNGADQHGTGNASGADGASGIADEELLTDEDRVVELIRENGGRMKQVRIVEETGWSKSKVSMLLSDMEEEDTISKLRVGRENIISLEGFEPEATKSPLDE